MQISSPVFNTNEMVPITNTCIGPNVNPPLEFTDVPSEAKSLVLLIEDTDAEPSPWVHWFVFNIPPTTTSVKQGEVPTGGVEGHANGGTPGYEGPCPKFFSGIHHYYFRLFALDTILDLPNTADKTMVEPAMQGHIIDKAVLIGLCEGPAVPTA